MLTELADLSNDLERVYDVVTRGRLDEVEAMLARFTVAERSREPRALALRAMCSVLGGDAPDGIGLLRRAIARSDSRTRPYMIDLLVPLLITSFAIDDAERVLDQADEVDHVVYSPLLALRSVVAAYRGADELSRRLAIEAVTFARESDYPMVTARVLQRSSLAAFYREDFVEAQERGLEAARAYERLGSFRNAAIAYSVPYVISHAWFGDPALARFYAKRVMSNGRRAEDLSWRHLGLVGLLRLAADTGDERELGALRARLMATSLHQQYSERFSIVIAGVLADGWSGRLDAARGALVSLRSTHCATLARSSLCEALLGLLAAARWDLNDARRLAHLVLSQTIRPVGREALSEAHSRRIARIVAAATCLIIGDTIRGRRGLSGEFDPDGILIQSITSQGADESSVPATLRGYARLIDIAAKRAASSRPALSLTMAELEVLRALPDGTTLALIAGELRKSPGTVKKQTQVIYAKLGVTNRIQAIRRARELRII